MNSLVLAVLQPLIMQILRHLWPNAPLAVASVLATAIPATVEFVEELSDDDDLRGEEKRHAVVDATKEYLDAALAKFPEWSKLKEPQRDRMLDGLAEFSHWMVSLEGEGRKPLRKLKKGLRNRRRG